MSDSKLEKWRQLAGEAADRVEGELNKREFPVGAHVQEKISVDEKFWQSLLDGDHLNNDFLAGAERNKPN